MDDGSRSIERIGLILRTLEAGPADGMTIGEVASAIHVDRTTVRRAIVSLERIGLIDKDPRSTRYRLGTYLFSLGAKTARRFDSLSNARETIRILAEKTGDTVVLAIRNKYDVVCVDMRSGGYPLKAQTLSIGESVPLGVSSAGLAILATMDDDCVRHVVQYNSIKISEFHRVRPQDLFGHVEETRKRGYALYRGHIVAGMGALGFAIRDWRGEASAAISISAVLDRLTDLRVKSLVQQFSAAIADIERQGAVIAQGAFGKG